MSVRILCRRASRPRKRRVFTLSFKNRRTPLENIFYRPVSVTGRRCIAVANRRRRRRHSSSAMSRNGPVTSRRTRCGDGRRPRLPPPLVPTARLSRDRQPPSTNESANADCCSTSNGEVRLCLSPRRRSSFKNPNHDRDLTRHLDWISRSRRDPPSPPPPPPPAAAAAAAAAAAPRNDRLILTVISRKMQACRARARRQTEAASAAAANCSHIDARLPAVRFYLRIVTIPPTVVERVFIGLIIIIIMHIYIAHTVKFLACNS